MVEIGVNIGDLLGVGVTRFEGVMRSGNDGWESEVKGREQGSEW